MATKFEVVSAAPKQGRRNRSPRHQFYIRQRPWEITPFLIAPVLPGETMKNLLVQGRVRSEFAGNIRVDPLVGWFHETYFFYVKHRDLEERDLVTQMHLDPQADLTALVSPAAPRMYHSQPGINWVKLCLESVVAEYFRDEGEGVWDFKGPGLDGEALPLASLNVDHWSDSMKLSSQVHTHDDELPGEDDHALPPGIPVGFEAHYTQWQHMRAIKLTEATFEDYIKSFGVRPAAALREEKHKPELLRYLRDWAYPGVGNAVTGLNADGTTRIGPYDQVKFDVTERADKDRYFAEPGFVFGVTVARPKVYFSTQRAAGVSMLDNAYAWVPAVLQDEPYTSLRKYLAGEGPIAGVAEEYWVDVRDLFVHGDQFVNIGINEFGFNAAAFEPASVYAPRSQLQRRYAIVQDQEKRPNFLMDGVVSLTIASTISDTSL
jgi:hypothetical protein